MTQDEIIEMAGHRQVSQWVIKLVADAVAKEREACAKLVDDIEWKCITDDVDDPSLKEVVKAIRARGKA